MSDIRKLLETMDRMSTVERKSTGPKFPGYWKGTDPASKAKDKMVGGCEENILKDLHSTAKERVTEWSLLEKFNKFKEQTSNPSDDWAAYRAQSGPDLPKAELDRQWNAYRAQSGPDLPKAELDRQWNATKSTNQPPAYSGIDPIVRQRMGMQPASQSEIQTYLDKNPPVIKTGTGEPVRSGSGAPVGSAGQIDVAKAADAVSPDRAQSVARAPTQTTSVKPVTPAAVNPGQSNLAGPPDTFIKNADGEWVENPKYSINRSVTPAPAPAVAPAAVSQSIAARDNTSSAADVSTDIFPADKTPATVTQQAAPVRAPYRGSNSAREIQAANPSIRDVNKIQAGQRLKLPNSDEDYVVQRGDTLDKIGKMYRSGEIGGRVVGGDGPTTAPAARPAPAAAAQPTAPQPAASAPQPVSPTVRSAPAASAPQPAVRPDDRAGRGTGRVETPSTAPAAAAQPSAATSQTNSTHPPGTQVQLKISNVKDQGKLVNGGRPMDITVMKGADGKWYNPKGQPVTFQKPGDLDNIERMPALQLPRVAQDVSKPPGVPAGSMSTPNFLKAPLGSFQNYRKGSDGEWYRQDGTRVIRSDLIQNLEKNAKSAKAPVDESNREDEKIAGRYDPDEFDLMVKRLGQKAREQDRKHGPVDIAALAKRLRAIEKREPTKEEEDPAVNMQDPDIQRTSQTSPQQDPAAVKQQQLDQTVDMATAKGTMSGLKTALGPNVDTNALASAVTKISDGKPLTGPESTSMSALTPLISKAAETPQTAMALKTALSNAGMLAKQGK